MDILHRLKSTFSKASENGDYGRQETDRTPRIVGFDLGQTEPANKADQVYGQIESQAPQALSARARSFWDRLPTPTIPSSVLASMTIVGGLAFQNRLADFVADVSSANDLIVKAAQVSGLDVVRNRYFHAQQGQASFSDVETDNMRLSARYLHKNPDLQISLRDCDLSETGRAANVAKILTENFGVASQRVTLGRVDFEGCDMRPYPAIPMVKAKISRTPAAFSRN